MEREPFEMIGQRRVVDAIRTATAHRSRDVYHDEDYVEPPNDAQIGMVLRSLADHTLMLQAITFDRDETWPDEPDRVSASVGRWMHQAANAFEEEWRTRPSAATVPTEDEEGPSLAAVMTGEASVGTE